MQSLSATSRSQHLCMMANTNFDVLVIGGGITGAGVALDAAARGYKVALVEKADFASGTSSKSTKLVHGGIRYLPNFDFALVHEALTEQSILLRIAPFLVKPVGFVLPVYEGERHPVGLPISPPGGIGLSLIMNIGLWLYDSMAGQRTVHRHRHLQRDEIEKLAPALVTHGLKYGFIYYDAQTNDVRLTMSLIHTAAQYGAIVANYAEVSSFVSEHGKVCGACIHDHVGNQVITVRARYIVNATGIYTERVEGLLGHESQVQVDPSKGVHLVLARESLQLGENAIVLPETDDKRILFIVPWQSRVIFGTTDTGAGDLDHPVATKEDIAYLLNHLNRYLSIRITEADIISVYAGYRPLVQSRTSAHSTARLSRTHAVLQSPSGLFSIVGGKLTTYRRMAQDTVDAVCHRDGVKPQHITQNIPLFGSSGWPSSQRELEVKGALLGLSPQTIAHLGWSYGSEATRVLNLIERDTSLSGLLVEDLPYIRAEVVYACRYEMAMTPFDVLARRTSILIEDRQRGLGSVEDTADLMAKEHSWSTVQRQSMVEVYCNAIEQQIADEKAS